MDVREVVVQVSVFVVFVLRPAVVSVLAVVAVAVVVVVAHSEADPRSRKKSPKAGFNCPSAPLS